MTEALNSMDELAPAYLGETRISLSVLTTDPKAHMPVEVRADVSRTDPEGLLLPLELIIQGPSSSSYQRRVFSRTVPTSIIFTPREGGLHMVKLSEVAHNRWWGVVTLTVAGDQLETPRPM